MGQTTKIEWTDATWNPIRGCSRVSEGCRNCYAESIAARFSGEGKPFAGLAKMTAAGPRWTGEVRLVEKHLEDPLRWKTPRKIFVNSMSDLFHPGVQATWLMDIFEVMARASHHTFQILTKRPAKMRDFLTHRNDLNVLRNVWLGVSVEDQATADERIPLLLETPAAVRFISAEPLLGLIDLRGKDPQSNYLDAYESNPKLSWVICGGESGPYARPMYPDWARSLRDQCRAAGVTFFFKQWGEFAPHKDGCGCRGEAISDIVHFEPVGKHVSGFALDGREHKDFPRC